MLDLIQWRARKSPESPALFFNGRWYTYRELEGRANRLAHRLLSLGVQRGDCISVLARNHPVHIDLLLAAPKIGIVCAPLNPDLPAATLSKLAARIKPAMVFADSRHHTTAAGFGVQWARLSDYREWLAVGSPDALPAVPLTVDDPLLLYATPRGLAEQPYRQVLLNARHAADAWSLSPQDCTVHCLPCHGPEFNLLCLPLFYRGGRVVLMSGFDTDEFLGHLALHRVSVAALTPEMLRRLTQYEDFTEADLSSIDWLASVGGPVAGPVREALTPRGLKLRLLPVLAEAGPNLFHADIGDCESRPELLGRALADAQLSVRRADGQPAEAGDAGELFVAGPMVFTGYRDEPAATTPLATGLAVRHGRDGQFSLLGRSADAFASGGQMLYPGEVEAALLRCEGVLDGVVFGVPQSGGENAIVAALVLQNGINRDDNSLLQELGQMLLSPLRPTRFYRLKQIPRDGQGQPDRLTLVQNYIQTLAAA